MPSMPTGGWGAAAAMGATLSEGPAFIKPESRQAAIEFLTKLTGDAGKHDSGGGGGGSSSATPSSSMLQPPTTPTFRAR